MMAKRKRKGGRVTGRAGPRVLGVAGQMEYRSDLASPEWPPAGMPAGEVAFAEARLAEGWTLEHRPDGRWSLWGPVQTSGSW